MIGPLCPWFLPHHKHRTMERVMELTLSGHRFETSLIYLVDVTVFMRKSLQKTWNTQRCSYGF